MREQDVFLLKLFFFTCTLGYGQSFHGLGSSMYGGIQGVVYNPGQIATSPYKMDFNVVSIYSILGSDYSEISIAEGVSLRGGFDFREGKTNPKDDNNFYKNVDVMGPSAMIQFKDQQFVGLYTRVRGIFNLNNINGALLESVKEDFTELTDFKTSSENFSATLNVWGEAGLVYGYLIENVNYTIGLGGTVKYLQGAGSIHTFSSELETSYIAEEEMLTTSGDFMYGSTVDFESDNVEFDSFEQGFGFDVGMVFESHYILGRNDRLFRMGAAITDMGRIKYPEVETSIYDINTTVSTNIFNGDDVKMILDDNYDSEVIVTSQKIKLPTALHLFADYELPQDFYLGIESSISLRSSKRSNTSRIANYVTINPRMESKWLSIFSPVTFQQHTNLSWGLGLRMGYVILASESLLSNILSSSKTSDVYIAVKFPVF